MLLATTSTRSLARSRSDTERRRLQLLCHAAETQNRNLIAKEWWLDQTRGLQVGASEDTHTHTHLAESPSWIHHRRRTLKDLVSMILLKKRPELFLFLFFCLLVL